MAKLPKKEEELNAHHTEAYHLPDGVTLHVRCAVGFHFICTHSCLMSSTSSHSIPFCCLLATQH